VRIPTLDTPRLKLIAPDRNCESAYLRFYTDEAASRAYGGPLTASAACARLAADLGNWYLHGFGVWAIVSKRDGAIVGTCGYWQGKGWPRELTWWLLPEARGCGYAKEASVAALVHAYDGFGWDRVETYMNDTNDLARALVIRLGGQKVARQRFPDGLDRDLYWLPRPSDVPQSQP
jgi:RimJ/RimL family protein N-acetyltransferase